MVQRLTIIVLSYERHRYLRRQLLYFEGKPVHILFADGSDDDWELGDSGSAGEMSWEYFRIPGFNTRSRRLAEASARVNTEFVCLLDDEECLLWSGLQRAMGELDAAPERSCAGGVVAKAEILAGNVYLVPWGRWSQPWSLTQESPLSRFEEVAMNHRTANLFYQVMRVKDLKHHASNMADCAVFVPSALEVGLAGFLALRGKWVMGNYPFWIRNGGSAIPPPGTTDYIARLDAAQLASALTLSLSAAGQKFEDGPSWDSLENSIQESIMNGWGDSLVQVSDSWSNTVSKTFRRRYRESRMIGGKLARAYMPSLFRHRNNQWGKAMAVTDFFEEFGGGGLAALQDLLLIKSIWTEFPRGVPSEVLRKD